MSVWTGTRCSCAKGPTYQHRVLWTYQRKGLPLRVIAQYDVWRRVKDKDGTVGWILDSMLSRGRMAVVAGRVEAPVHPAPIRRAM